MCVALRFMCLLQLWVACFFFKLRGLSFVTNVYYTHHLYYINYQGQAKGNNPTYSVQPPKKFLHPLEIYTVTAFPAYEYLIQNTAIERVICSSQACDMEFVMMCKPCHQLLRMRVLVATYIFVSRNWNFWLAKEFCLFTMALGNLEFAFHTYKKIHT